MQFVFGDLIFTTKMTVLLSSGTVGYRRVQEPSSRYTTGISVGSNVNGAELYSSIILCFPRSYSNTRLNKTTITKYKIYSTCLVGLMQFETVLTLRGKTVRYW